MTAVLKNISECLDLRNQSNVTPITGINGMIQKYEILAVIIGFGAFACLLASFFNYIRNNVYNDKNNLDTSFDAGGKVNAGLTATTVVSQWTWAATLLQSSTVASKYGVSGPFWYAAGATIQILLFSILSVQLKIRAPGAKTFLQVIKARFGSRTHKVYCVFALMTNIIVTAMLMLGGSAVLTSLIENICLEYATILVAAVIGTYTFIGGLGATFYVSYFNTAIIYIIIIVFVLKIYNDDKDSSNPLGSIERVYDLIACSQGPSENAGGSYLTILSKPGLMFGLINIVGNFGTVFVDQSYWQSSVAAKPRQGVLGFLFGGICWFAIPFGLASTTGLAYIALSASQNQPLLTDDKVDEGLVAPVVAQRLMGKSGEYMMIIMILMAVTSTGSAEVIAVTSILVYDVYRLYLKPFRLVLDANSCILCGKAQGRLANPRDKCTCESMKYCQSCMEDDRQAELLSRKSTKRKYTCKTHGPYREYTDYLMSLKNWCLVWTTMAMLPLTVLLSLLGISLAWVYMFMGTLIGSAVVPIALCMFWERLTGIGMITGSISGTSLALIVWLVVASTYEGGLSNFLTNTGKEVPMLCGNIVAIISGGLITIVVSLTGYKKEPYLKNEVWENTRDIDNPLCPWTELYEKDLDLTAAHQLDNKPSIEDVEKVFRGSKLLAGFASVILTILIVIFLPCLMIAFGIMNYDQFKGWVTLSEAWVFVAAIFIILTPVVFEARDIHLAFKQKRQVGVDQWIPTSRKSTKSSKSAVPYRKAKPSASQSSEMLPSVVDKDDFVVGDVKDEPIDPIEVDVNTESIKCDTNKINGYETNTTI